MHGILIILFIFLNLPTLSYTGNKVMRCPSIPEWNHRAQEYCLTNPQHYHCLQLQGDDGYIELCRPAIPIPMGKYARWSEAAQKIYELPCPPERYQEVPTSSNKHYQCEKEKSICNEEGELTYRDGDTVTDRTCRCDYKAGYTANIYAWTNVYNRTYYFPKQVHRGCERFNDCKADEELNPAYRCVKKCSKGYYRPDLEFHCVHNPSATSPKTTTTESVKPTLPQTTTTLHPGKPVTDVPPTTAVSPYPESRTLVKVLVGFGIVFGVILLFALLSFLWMKSLHAFIPEFETHVKYNEEYTLHCNIYNTVTPGKLICHWSKVDDYDVRHPIGTGDLYKISSERKKNEDKSITVSSLTIRKVTEETEGSYECEVRNLFRYSHAETYIHTAGGGPTEETPQGEIKAIFPDESGKWKYMDYSGTELSRPNTPKSQRPMIYIEHYHEGPTTNIEQSENTIIGPKGKIQYVSYHKGRTDKDQESTSSGETERTPKPKGKRKKRKERRSPTKSTSDGGDTTNDEEDSLLPERKPVHSTQNDSMSEYRRSKQLLDELAREKYKLKVVDVRGDGSCLYHAVLHQLESVSSDANTLRKALIKFFETNPSMSDGTNYQDFLCLPLDSDRGRIQPEDIYIEKNIPEENNQKALRWQRFLKRIQDGEWGGDLEIIGIAQHCQIEICVLCLNDRMDDLQEYNFNSENKKGDTDTIYIGHIRVRNRGYHFVAMCPLEERKKKDKDPLLVRMESLHYTLIDKIAQTVYHGSDSLRRLKTLLTPYLEPVDLQDKATFSDLCASLLKEELIKIGEYKFLKEQLKSIDLDKLVHFIDTAEDEIQDIKYNNNGLERRCLDEDTGDVMNGGATNGADNCDEKEIKADLEKDVCKAEDDETEVKNVEDKDVEVTEFKEKDANDDVDKVNKVSENGEVEEVNGHQKSSEEEEDKDAFVLKCKNNTNTGGMGDATDNVESPHINV